MKKHYSFAILCICMMLGISVNVNAQCDGSRYKDLVFSSVKMDSVVYSVPYSLKMDIYQPVGDLNPKRPLIILAHEGGFFAGDRRYDLTVDSLCVRFAKRGYVTVSYDYRLSTMLDMMSPDSSKPMDAVIKAISDGKAAIRYFMKDAATANIYKIDTNKIFIGGNSAGAVLSMHLGYVTSLSELSPLVKTAFQNNGGFDGNSSDASYAGYGIRYKGIISLAGGLYSSSYINAGDVSSVNFHGDADNIVPYTCDWAFGGMGWIKLCGLGSLKPEYTAKNIFNHSKVFAGAGHVPWDTDMAMFKTADSLIQDYLYSLVCIGATSVNEISAKKDVSVYPNPTSDLITINAPEAMSSIQIVDAMGRNVIQQAELNSALHSLNTSHLSKGLYYIKIMFKAESYPVIKQFLIN